MSHRVPVLVLFNEPRPPADDREARPESDAGVLAQVEAVVGALERLGHFVRSVGVQRLSDVTRILSAATEPVVFNLVESLPFEPEDCNHVPALCHAFGKGCTGNPSSAMTNGLDKWTTRALLQQDGLTVPPGFLVRLGESAPADRPAGRSIVKPLRVDASEGLDATTSVVDDGPSLARAVAAVHERFAQPALVERFVGTRELNVSVVEFDGTATVMPIAEIDFSALGADRPHIVDYAAKWVEGSFEFHNTPRILPADLDVAMAERVRSVAVRAFRAVGCRDYARVDLRLDDESGPVVLEVNPNPDIARDAGFSAAVEASGRTYDEFIAAMVANASSRVPAPSGPVDRRPADGSVGDVSVRVGRAGDAAAITALTAATGFFSPAEVDIANEVAEEACAKGLDGHYVLLVAELSGQVVGWVCIGHTPCTISTFDLYWLAVSPDVQGKGVGKILVARAEDAMRERGGTLSIVETAGRPVYEPTRQFYLRVGYTEGARLEDFYAPGDAKVVYVKRL